MENIEDSSKKNLESIPTAVWSRNFAQKCPEIFHRIQPSICGTWAEFPKEAVILVGGLGTRLKHLTKDCPKPMLLVGDKPFLEYLLIYLKNQGVQKFILATAYKTETVKAYFGDGSRLGAGIVYADPNGQQLGTAGSIKFAEEHIEGGNFFALNGDVFFEAKLDVLWNEHQKTRAWATLALAQANDTKRYGSVVLDSNGLIKAFLEKQTMERPRSGLINGGIYVCDRKILSLIPPNQDFSLERDVFPKISGQSLRGVAFPDAYFIDIGTPEDYERAQKELPARFVSK